MAYSRQGVNYGIGGKTGEEINSSLGYLSGHFPNCIRITHPAFDGNLAYWQDVVMRAKAKGFKKVIWGISCPTSRTWDWYKFIQAFIDTANWAFDKGIIFGVNEEAWHLIRSNMTQHIPIEVAVGDLYAAATMIKAKKPQKLYVAMAQPELDHFISKGSGPFDYMGLNLYDTLPNKQLYLNKLVNAFGNKSAITEFSKQHGFNPEFGGTEQSWYDEIKQTVELFERYPQLAFYCAYTTLGDNHWNYKKDDGTWHKAWDVFTR